MQKFSLNQIVLGGCLLAFSASFLNTGFIINMGTSVSHLTGDISRIGSGLSAINEQSIYTVFTVTIAALGFICGSIFVGFFLQQPKLEIRMPYGRSLSILGIILFIAHYFYASFPLITIALASAVCGCQNALASRFRGVVLRTTHLTGLFTDLGVHIGMKLKGNNIARWKLIIPICITGSFLLGAISCAALIFHGKENWILYAAFLYFFGGICWSIYKRTLLIKYDEKRN